MLNDPSRKPLIVDHTFITVPVEREVEVAVMEWIAEHLSDLETRLAPLGLIPGDLAVPDWHRLVYEDEVNVEIGRQS